MSVHCADPEFIWDALNEWWRSCVHCGHPAWSHPQADPLQDLRNMIYQVQHGLPGSLFPPAMRPAAQGTTHDAPRKPETG